MYATPGRDQGSQAGILPDSREHVRVEALNARRRFLAFAAAAATGGLAAACGVKGPLYLPEDPEDDQDKKKDEENVSGRLPAADARDRG